MVAAGIVVAVWCWLTQGFARQCFGVVHRRWHRLRGISTVYRDEEGASYVLPLVMTIPLYLFFCLFVSEIVLLSLTKVGTTYAAYAGARSSAVWMAQKPNLQKDRMRQAVVSGLSPFVASGHQLFGVAGDPKWPIDVHLNEYLLSLERFSERSIDRASMSTHFRRVAARTSIDHDVSQSNGFRSVTVKVTYRAPFLFAVVARWLDPDHRAPYEMPVRSVATFPIAEPKTQDGTLGIDYLSF